MLGLGYVVAESIVSTLVVVLAVFYNEWRRGSSTYLFIEHVVVVFFTQLLVQTAVYLFFHGRIKILGVRYVSPIHSPDQSYWASGEGKRLAAVLEGRYGLRPIPPRVPSALASGTKPTIGLMGTERRSVSMSASAASPPLRSG